MTTNSVVRTQATAWNQSESAYRVWMKSTGLPIHRGYFIGDLRTLELGYWEERGCNAAFLELAGQEGVVEARVTEIEPGKTLPPFTFSLDEAVYVVQGRGLTTVWQGDRPTAKSFEWQKHSMFLLPHNHTYQLSNMDGKVPVRLLHYNYLPIVMELIPDPEFLFNNSHQSSDGPTNPNLYAEAQEIVVNGPRIRTVWTGNFFPNLAIWDKLDAYGWRGAGGQHLTLRFPGCPIRSHMSVFPSRTYKKAHRHGPGVLIVIPAGEGYSLMWPDGQKKIEIPWHEASAFVPPDMWFHQHFNVGAQPARYLAFHMPAFMRMSAERVIDPTKDQIEYVNEDPWVRQKFKEELGKRGITSLMPDAAFSDPNYKFKDLGAD
jgi:hypothetical protein